MSGRIKTLEKRNSYRIHYLVFAVVFHILPLSLNGQQFEGWITRDHKVTWGGWDWLYVHAGATIVAVNKQGEAASIPSSIEIENSGKHALYFTCQRTGDSELEVKAGTKVVRPLQGLFYKQGKATGVEQVEVRVKAYVEGLRRSDLHQAESPSKTEEFKNLGADRSSPLGKGRQTQSLDTSPSVDQAIREKSAKAQALALAKSELRNLRERYASMDHDKNSVVNDFITGWFCSQCQKSATEIESGKKESFNEHLIRVQGHRIPATKDQIKSKLESYEAEMKSISDQMNILIKDQHSLCKALANAETDVENAFDARTKVSKASGQPGRSERLRRVTER